MAIVRQHPVNPARPVQTAPDMGMDVHIPQQMYEQVVATLTASGIQPDF
jgi:hypothetical protein